MKIKKIALLGLLIAGAMNNPAMASCEYKDEADDKLRKEVDRTIDRYPHLDKDVSINVEDGRVILSGKVDSRAEEEQAVQLASGIAGVKSVDDRLEIKK